MENEALGRLAIFLGIFAALALWEVAAPRRSRALRRRDRWLTNWAISILDVLTLRAMALVLPLLAIGAAADAGEKGWGLLNQISLPLWAEIVITLLVFDFAIWAQHVLMHRFPLLWRLHRVHHADRDFDVTTAIRFHPVEIALSMLIKIGLAYLIGPPVLGVLLFEVILNGMAMFNHANINLPQAVDRWLRLLVVTPDMHRVHHSIYRAEHDANYGFNLSVWDRLFGSYVPAPRDGHERMAIGLAPWQDQRPARLGWSLMLPFR
ncbi:MAG TPA: sterol desaturase family protein [Paracoccaceae bacterium]|nr:sterol desaturase family protein [Paracoccaceae bacterium]